MSPPSRLVPSLLGEHVPPPTPLHSQGEGSLEGLQLSPDDLQRRMLHMSPIAGNGTEGTSGAPVASGLFSAAATASGSGAVSPRPAAAAGQMRAPAPLGEPVSMKEVLHQGCLLSGAVLQVRGGEGGLHSSWWNCHIARVLPLPPWLQGAEISPSLLILDYREPAGTRYEGSWPRLTTARSTAPCRCFGCARWILAGEIYRS